MRCGARARLVIVMIVETLGEDLLLLAIRPNGTLGVAQKLRFGLSGSELVRLAAARRVDIERGRIVVLDTAPTGDPLLDAALQSMQGGRRPPAAKAWVARQRPGLVERYLDRLAAAGAIRSERRKALGFIPATRWLVLDTARLADVRSRLDAIASGSPGPGSPSLSSAQAAFAGLADAIGLAALLYPGFAAAAARKRLKNAAKLDRSAEDVTSAAMDASVRAATDAAVAASIDAATQAAVSAATEAAHHAASHAGSHGGATGGHH